MKAIVELAVTPATHGAANEPEDVIMVDEHRRINCTTRAAITKRLDELVEDRS